MKKHYLKCYPEYYKEVISGKKTFEVRFNDRKFKEGDIIVLQEYKPQNKEFTGKEAEYVITFILDGFAPLAENFVVFSIVPYTEKSKATFNSHRK